MIAFVTGANKGLGLETARRLVALDHDVLLGARDPVQGHAAAEALGPRARFVQLDVTDDDSVRRAATDVAQREGRVDILVNNAGVPAPRKPVGEITTEDVKNVFGVNVFGVFRVLSAFLPLLARSDSAVVVNVGSGLGSFARTGDDAAFESKVISPIYASSKAALSMLTVQYAKALPEMRVNAVDPGFTKTDLNGGAGMQTLTEGTDAIIAMASIGRDGPTGTFTDRAGPVGW